MGTKKGSPTRSEFSELTLGVRGLGTRLDALSTEVKGVRAELTTTRLELGGRIEELGERIEGMGERIEGMDERIEGLGERANENTGMLRQILRAVEVGTDRRDGRVDDLEQRVRKLEEHTGLVS